MALERVELHKIGGSCITGFINIHWKRPSSQAGSAVEVAPGPNIIVVGAYLKGTACFGP